MKSEQLCRPSTAYACMCVWVWVECRRVHGQKPRLPATLSNFFVHDFAATLPVRAATAASSLAVVVIVAAVIAVRKPCGCVGNSDVDNCERLLTLDVAVVVVVVIVGVAVF